MLHRKRHIVNSGVLIFLLGMTLGLGYVFISYHNLIFDLSRTHGNSLDGRTGKIIASLNFRVHIIVFEPAGSRCGKMRALLEGFCTKSRLLTCEIIDPDTHPGIARKYGIHRYGQTVLLGRNRQVLIDAATEQKVVDALIMLKQDRHMVINVLAGHGEAEILDRNGRGLSRLVDTMNKRGYALRRVTFAAPGSLLPDGDVLLIPGPETPLHDFEVEGLTRLVREGGKIILTLDPAEDGGLGHFLDGLGVGLSRACAVDRANKIFGGDETVLSVGNFCGVRPFSELPFPAIFPGTGTLTVYNGLPPRTSIISIASTSRASRTRVVHSQDSGEGDGAADVRDRKGPFNVGLFIARMNHYHTKAGIMVFGDTDFLTNAYLDVSGNKDLFIACVSKLLGEEDIMPSAPGSSGSSPFILTSFQAAILFVFVVIIIPCLIFLPGIILSRKRARL